MGHTQENSATYLLVSNFNESMKLKAFVSYLGLENIKLSKNAVIENGTHHLFNTPSVKIPGEPDMYILDNTNKNLILIENKVKVDRELEPPQQSEDGYYAIIKDYINDGYNAHLVYLVPREYWYTEEIKKLIKKHPDNIHIITWDKFFDNFDTDTELAPIKKAIQAIEIDGIDLEQEFFDQPVDLSLVSPTIKKNEALADYYIGQLIYDACDYSNGNKKNLWKGEKVKTWQRPRIDAWLQEDLLCTEYCDSPCVEIIFHNDENFYMAAGYDYIQQRFCVFIENYHNKKFTVEYCNEIQLPIGLVKSYYALKSKFVEQLHDFIQTIQSGAKNNKALK